MLVFHKVNYIGATVISVIKIFVYQDFQVAAKRKSQQGNKTLPAGLSDRDVTITQVWAGYESTVSSFVDPEGPSGF